MIEGEPNLGDEVRAREPDLRALREKVLELGAAYEGKDDQRDTYFAVDDGYLKVRVSELDRDAIVFYRRARKAAPRAFEAWRAGVEDSGPVLALLDRAFGTRATIRKTREAFVRQNVRILFDRLPKGRTFVTLRYDLGPAESERDATDELARFMERLGIGSDDAMLVADSYCEIV